MTSRPIIVTSIPLAKTRCAASGSAQMLNSAAGVTLPSPIAPPIRTIRSRPRVRMQREQQRDVRQRAGGDERERLLARADLRGDEVDRVLGDRLRRAAAAASGPSSPVSPWTYAATTRSRTSGAVGAGGDRHVAAAGELEHAQRVRGRLLERLVAARRS